MRSLVIFADMLGGEYINLCNGEMPYADIDEFLERLGGTVYTNCYTPAPDTGRSSACMWTGYYPKKNHCDHRLKYPRYYLNDEIDNIWKRMEEAKYRVNVFADSLVVEDGLFPISSNMHIYSDGIADFLNNAEIQDNTLCFFYLPDIHVVLNELGYSAHAYKEGVTELLRGLNCIFEKYDVKEKFDYVIILSDHGFRLSDKMYKNVLYRDRTHTYIQLWKKGDTGIEFDDKLRSNLDLYPTIYELEGWNLKEQIDGVSLLDKNGHSYILMEDHENFYPSVSQGICAWGVITESGVHHWIGADDIWNDESKEESFDEIFFIDEIQKKMCDYQRQKEIFEYAQIYLSHAQRECRNSLGDKLEKKFIFEDIERLRGNKVILYGAGRVGKDYFRQIMSEKDIQLVAWIDNNYEKLNDRDYPMILSDISEVYKHSFDYIIISIYDRKESNFIKKILVMLGVDEKKVLNSIPKEILMKGE
ncbi:hypothetical protein D6853_12965 [Butyrivibrio sp. X503]|nr:hypothetical protein D6853_12965 [Butyrivibrio sp. X503]